MMAKQPQQSAGEPETGRNDTPAHDATLVRVRKIALEIARASLRSTDASELIEDIAQDVALRIWEHLQDGTLSFDDGRPLERYVFALTQNMIVDYRRSAVAAQGDVTGSLEELSESTQLTVTPPDLPARIDRADALEELLVALETMAPARAAAFRLVRNQGLSLKEAAKKRGVTVNTLKSQLYAADNIVGAALAKYREVSK
jgi:RNA polymerase sigma factor (sigma-70 family)